MSISSISSSEALYWASLAQKANTTAATTVTTDDSTSSKKVTSSTDSSVTQDSFAELMSMLSAISAMYAGNTQSNTSEDNPDSDLRSFLDKVKNGTVTTEDLSNMQALLTSSSTSSNQSTKAGNDFDSSLTSFLDKVKKGTVTTDDLTSLQALLANGPAQSNQNSQELSQQLLATAANAYESDYQSGNDIASTWKI